jgi:hypothetical protein
MSIDVKHYLSYDKDSGQITWIAKLPAARIQIGSVAGNVGLNGYRYITFNNKRIFAHRLAWFLYHGSWPIGDIDHINGDKCDNRIVNLRDVSTRVNCQNRSYHRAGKPAGCYFDKSRNKWLSQIRHGGKRYHVGYFNSQDEAVAAYNKKAKELDDCS